MVYCCPLCGASREQQFEEWILRERGEDLRYLHCRSCDLIFLDPKLLASPLEERQRYLQHNNSPEAKGYISYLENFAAEAVLPCVRPPQRLLDFGSGPSPVFAALLREKGFTVDIFDPYFAPDLQWKEQQYDGVTAVEVAEHIYQPIEAFSSLAAVILPGGYLILRTLLHYSDRERFASWWYRQDASHVTFYSPRSFEVLCSILPFRLVEIKEGRSIILQRKASSVP